MEPARGRRFQVTERDLEMVEWIGRQRFAEGVQVARRFGMDERNTRRRLRGLVDLGFLGHRLVFHHRRGAYWATQSGLMAAGVRLAPAGIDIRTYEHDRLAAELAIDLEQEFGRAAVATERELRSYDAQAAEPRYGVRRGMSSGRSALHFPDIAIDSGDGRPLVVEVELTAKGRARLDSIINGYVRARHIEGVRYYVAGAARRGVERAVARAGAGDLIDVRSIAAEGQQR